MPSKPFDCVLLGAHSQYRGVMMGLARLLKERGVRVHLYCASKQEHDYYRLRHGGHLDSITINNSLYAGLQQVAAKSAATFDEARRNELRLGVTYNCLAMTDRHLGRGYALGGFNHPRSHVSRGTSYVQLVAAYNRSVEFWRREIGEKRPDVVINCGKVAAVIARSEGLPYRALAGSRYRNLHYWAVNEFLENPALEEAYAKITGTTDLEITGPYDTFMEVRRLTTRTHTLAGTVQRMAYATAQQVYWNARGYDKGRSYFLREMLDYLWRCYRDRVRLGTTSKVRLADLQGQRFVFYPLQTEPETALQTLSPEYFYQLSSIAALSRDLPAGVVLAVKEHFPAIGRRPSDFYEQIREFKNVVLLDINEFGLQCARQADATATITGTSGFEAAITGRPVISFGRHNLFNFLPHVMVVDDEVKLAGFLQRVFGGGIDAEKARIDGLRLLQAIVSTSFDLTSFKMMAPDFITDDAANAATHALLRSLDNGRSDARQLAMGQ